MERVELLAHQGGWDEILMVLGPVVIFVYLLVIARKRAVAIADAEAQAADAERPAADAEDDPAGVEDAPADS